MIVGYLTGTYPRASDTFIQREVDGVRAAGVQVRTYSVRRPSEAHLVGPEQKREHASTTYLLPASPSDLVRAQRRAIGTPHWRSAVRTAVRTRSPGGRAAAYQGIYFAEAALLAERLVADGVEHLHNHFGDQSGTVAMLAAELVGIPFSMTIHGPHIFFEPERWALGAKVDAAAFTACISHFCRSQVMVFASEAQWSDLHVIHCGVNPQLFEAPANSPVERFRIVTVSRLAAEKGLPLLLRAASSVAGLLPGLEVVMVGDGPGRSDLEGLGSALGLPVRFTGNLNQEGVRDLLRETDVLLSAGLAEGIPTALMEAMASRVPVIASGIAGVPELVEDGVSGRLVRPGDEAGLAEALVELCAMGPKGRRAWGEAGRTRVLAEFDAGLQAARLAELFRSKV